MKAQRASNSAAKILFRQLAPFGLLCALLALGMRQMFGAAPLPGIDGGVFLYAGWSLLEGRAPYREVWDHKGPLLYALNALGLWLGSGGWRGVILLEFGFLCGAIWLGWQAFSRLFSPRSAFWASAIWVVNWPFYAGGKSNFTESWNLVFQFGALWIWVQFLNASSQSPRRIGALSFGLGVCLAGGLLLRPNQAALALLVALFCAFSLRAFALQTRFLALIGWLLGLTLPLLGFGFWLAKRGSWPDFIDQYWFYNLAYSQMQSGATRWETLVQWLRELEPHRLLWLSAPGLLIASFPRLRLPENRSIPASVAIFLLLAFLVDGAMALMRGVPHGHYFLVCLPSLSLATALLLWRLEAFSPTIGRGLTTVLGLVLLFNVALFSRQIYRGRQNWEAARARPILDFVARETTAQQAVLFWGGEARMNFLSRRRSPTRFVYYLPLVRPRSYATAELGHLFVQEFQRDLPALILDTSQPTATFSSETLPPLDLIKNGRVTDRARWQILAPAVQIALREIDSHFEWRGETLPGPTGNRWRVFRPRKKSENLKPDLASADR